MTRMTQIARDVDKLASGYGNKTEEESNGRVDDDNKVIDEVDKDDEMM